MLSEIVAKTNLIITQIAQHKRGLLSPMSLRPLSLRNGSITCIVLLLETCLLSGLTPSTGQELCSQSLPKCSGCAAEYRLVLEAHS